MWSGNPRSRGFWAVGAGIFAARPGAAGSGICDAREFGVRLPHYSAPEKWLPLPGAWLGSLLAWPA